LRAVVCALCVVAYARLRRGVIPVRFLCASCTVLYGLRVAIFCEVARARVPARRWYRKIHAVAGIGGSARRRLMPTGRSGFPARGTNP